MPIIKLTWFPYKAMFFLHCAKDEIVGIWEVLGTNFWKIIFLFKMDQIKFSSLRNSKVQYQKKRELTVISEIGMKKKVK